MLARKVGADAGPFDYVTTSSGPRTIETALAMGFAVDKRLDVLGDIADGVVAEVGHHDRWSWPEPFANFAEIVQRGGATARMGQEQRDAWREALGEVAPGGGILVISHGRVIESGLVACFPDADYRSWGAPFGHCEGVRLGSRDGEFTGPEFLRVPNAWHASESC